VNDVHTDTSGTTTVLFWTLQTRPGRRRSITAAWRHTTRHYMRLQELICISRPHPR